LDDREFRNTKQLVIHVTYYVSDACLSVFIRRMERIEWPLSVTLDCKRYVIWKNALHVVVILELFTKERLGMKESVMNSFCRNEGIINADID
jgi:hypothetical protein